jgi:hypothetical protein
MTKNQNPMKNYKILFALFVVLFIASCSGIKSVPEGELLYTGGKITVTDTSVSKKQRSALKSEFEDLLRPKPNKKFLGMRPKLFFYNLAGDVKKEKGFRYWLKFKVGEEPVLFSQVDLEYNKSVLQNYAENKGYFNARTAADSTRSGKTATADYTIKPQRQYTIKSVTFPTDSTGLSGAIKKLQRRSLLKVDQPYNLEVIKAERVRIDGRLKEKGYFYFNEDYLKIQVDSTVADHKVDLKLMVKEETPEIAKKDYRINKIVIYPNYSITSDSASIKTDSIVKYNDFTIIDKDNLFKPRVFDRVLYFKKDDLYNRTNHNLKIEW